MTTVAARVSVGFNASAQFLILPQASRIIVKQNIQDDLDAVLDEEARIAALSVPFEVDADHSASDEDVKQLIQDQLDEMSSAEYELVAGALQTIHYTYDGDVRYCHHAYAVMLNENIWSVEHMFEGDPRENIVASASW